MLGFRAAVISVAGFVFRSLFFCLRLRRHRPFIIFFFFSSSAFILFFLFLLLLRLLDFFIYFIFIFYPPYINFHALFHSSSSSSFSSFLFLLLLLFFFSSSSSSSPLLLLLRSYSHGHLLSRCYFCPIVWNDIASFKLFCAKPSQPRVHDSYWAHRPCHRERTNNIQLFLCQSWFVFRENICVCFWRKLRQLLAITMMMR